MRMLEAYDGKFLICARCGSRLCYADLTKDHFLPKYHIGSRFRIPDVQNLVAEIKGKDYIISNYVGLCSTCNKEKSSKIVGVNWYRYLSLYDRKILFNMHRLMYTRTQRGDVLHDSFDMLYPDHIFPIS